MARARDPGRAAGRGGAVPGDLDQVRAAFVPSNGLPFVCRHGSASRSIAHQLITVSLA
jgi:hypothetical protein